MKVTFSIRYHTAWGENLYLTTDRKKYPLVWNDGDIWCATVKAPRKDMMEYGYQVVREGIVTRREWSLHKLPEGVSEGDEIRDNWNDCPIPGCRFNSAHSVDGFDLPGFRGAGTAVPVFSLRSAGDFGIGDFRDLHQLVDWAKAAGQCIIQLLPINDTTRNGQWEDSYPYSPVSSFALHPLYLRLQDIGTEEDEGFLREQAELNALSEIDYPRVFKAKMARIREAWLARGRQDIDSAAFRRFAKHNSFWLDGYASFCAGRDGLEENYYRWMQFHLDRQLSEEVRHARANEIYLKGDLPIGVSRDSAEARWCPELFNLDSSAGAPPDFFSEDGQNWGFPTYNWEKMAEDGYLWWKTRLKKMAEYFDAFRIDHILGFFRIWEIPLTATSGKEGHFNPALPYSSEELLSAGLPVDGRLFVEDPRRKGYWHPRISPDTSYLEQWQKDRFDALYTDFFFHRHDAFWKDNAEKKLPELLGATGMLACGEDLGMIPDCVPGVMEHERILSLEMPMMDKGRPWPELSVCATSSHDMETLRMQKAEDPSPEDCARLLAESLSSASMLAIFPIQDWLSIDGGLRRKERGEERINEPANPKHHWRFRLHLNLEDMKKDPGFTAGVRSLLEKSGRLR